MYEVNPRSSGAPFRSFIEQTHSTLAEFRARRIDIGHRIGDLLDAGTVAVEELADGRIRPQRR